MFSKIFFKVVHNCTFINIYLVITIIAYIVLFGYSLVQYPAQNAKETLNTASPYLALLLAYPIFIYLLDRGDTKSLYRILDVFSIIIYIMILAQFITYKNDFI